uniref:Multidrug resistance-associated protein lethal(2)03659 n=1 Tax=Syphacia muris TaxID=451379 RepID=A0A0N5AH10_9BILA
MSATNLPPNPEISANFLSRITFFHLDHCNLFSFAIPFMIMGYRKTIEQSDLYEPVPNHNAKIATDKIIWIWKREMANAKKAGRKRSLFYAVMHHYLPRAFLLGILLFIEESLCVLQTVMIGRLIRYFSPNSSMSVGDACLAAAVIATAGALCPLIHHPHSYAMQKLGLELKIGVCGIIMHKGLRLSSGALQRTTIGHILTLMSNDAAKFDYAFLFVNYLCVGPFLLLVYIYLLWHETGPSCIAGFIALIMFIPLQSFFSRQIGRYRKLIAKRTDKRLSVMDQILSGIRVVKMYGWEDAFSGIVGELRRQELTYVRISNIWQSFVMGIFWASTKFIVLSVLITFTFFGNRIDAERAFVTTALFNACRHPLTLYIPFALQHLFESNVSLSRVQKFLELEEYDDLRQPILTETESESKITLKDDFSINGGQGVVSLCSTSNAFDSKIFVKAKELSATWDEVNTVKPRTVVKNVSFSAQAGDLVAIIGPVGAGKSSLLLSLLRETRLVKGSLQTVGVIAYAPQEPWLFSGTIRENILFGKPYDKGRYAEAIRVCCLRKDLMQLPHGDLSPVGDQGHSLSGGQKARISLARAIYSDADIYILDDPLSAVDAAVGRYLFKTCIVGHLSKKLTILVTHQVQFLNKATLVLLMENGQMVASGSFEDIGNFSCFSTDTQKSVEIHNSQASITENASVKLSELPELFFDSSESSNSDEVFFLAPEEISPLLEGERATDSLLKLSKAELSSYRCRRHSSASTVFSEASEYALDILLKNLQHKMYFTLGIIFYENLNAVKVWKISQFKPQEQAGTFNYEEDRLVGDVSWRIYLRYFNAMANPPCALIFAIAFAVAVQIFNNFIDWWLNKWSTASEKATLRAGFILLPSTSNFSDILLEQNYTYNDYADLLDFKLFQLHITLNTYRTVFTFASLFCYLNFRCIWFRTAQVNGSRLLHNRMFDTLITSPMTFFDQNPIGKLFKCRVLNRFSKDVGTMDDQLSYVFFEFFAGVLHISGISLLVLFLNPRNLISFIPLFLLFGFLREFYLASSRDVKRLEALSRSPLYSHISAVMRGLPIIRSFQKQSETIDKFYLYQNNNTAALFLQIVISRWFATLIDWLVAFMITAVAFFCILNKESQQSGEVALMMTYVVQFTGFVSWIMRQSAEVQNGMVSVERIIEYTELPVERVSEGILPAVGWPNFGKISFKNVSLKYNTNNIYVLKNVTFEILPKEKIGIVGRTGAGKSSLLSVLFRLVESEGTVIIDGVDTETLPLRELRKRLSIIPQEPVLFIGSLRRNLDPFNDYTDDRLWNALEQVELRTFVASLRNGLETRVEENGSNFSVGQRQLLCLARAVLKRSKILVIDEATANVDPETDNLIQRAIKRNFVYSTVLTVAHRLHTIVDSDKVMVLDGGCLMEFDHPYKLLCNEGSSFSALVSETGADTAKYLRNLAFNAYLAKKT